MRRACYCACHSAQVVFIVCTIVLYHNHDYIFKQSATLRPLELAPDASTQTPSAAKSSTTGKAKVVPKQARQEVKLNGTYEVCCSMIYSRCTQIRTRTRTQTCTQLKAQ